MTRWAAACPGFAVLLGTWLSMYRTAFAGRYPQTRVTRWSYALIGVGGTRLAPRLPRGLCAWYLGLLAVLALLAPTVCWLVTSTVALSLLGWAGYAIEIEPRCPMGFLSWRDGAPALVALTGVSAAFLVTASAVSLLRCADAYLQRERLVTELSARPGEPEAESVLADCLRAGSRNDLDQLLVRWIDWFTQVWYQQQRRPALLLLASRSRLTWLEVAVIMLDAAALARAVAPDWAPPSATNLTEVGSRYLQSATAQLRIQLRLATVSLHGREERRFSDTYQDVRDAVVADQQGERQAWLTFQLLRVQYAPYAAAIAQQLNSTFIVTRPQSAPRLRISSDHG